MYRLIVVPLDGSSLAAGALPYAVALARASGARVLLVRASLVRLPPPPDTYEATIVGDERAYLERTAELLRGHAVAVETAHRFADAAEAIVEAAAARGADLLVMTTHGRSGLGRLVLGSVAAAVVARAPAPVLLLPDAAGAREGAPFGLAPTLLVPLDGSASAETALPVANDLAAILAGGLVLLRAVSAEAEEADPVVAAARDYLRQVADRLPPAARPLELDARVGEPADAIVAAAREYGAALIVMATHDYGELRGIVGGSVAEAVVQRSSLPVVVVRRGPKTPGQRPEADEPQAAPDG